MIEKKLTGVTSKIRRALAYTLGIAAGGVVGFKYMRDYNLYHDAVLRNMYNQKLDELMQNNINQMADNVAGWVSLSDVDSGIIYSREIICKSAGVNSWEELAQQYPDLAQNFEFWDDSVKDEFAKERGFENYTEFCQQLMQDFPSKQIEIYQNPDGTILYRNVLDFSAFTYDDFRNYAFVNSDLSLFVDGKFREQIAPALLEQGIDINMADQTLNWTNEQMNTLQELGIDPSSIKNLDDIMAAQSSGALDLSTLQLSDSVETGIIAALAAIGTGYAVSKVGKYVEDRKASKSEEQSMERQ